MLIRFQVSNFLSLFEKQELALFPSLVKAFPDHVYKTDNDNLPGILKSALIYGANASGKSNLVKAMAYSRMVIVSDKKTNWDVPVFMLKEHPLNESEFLYEILIDKVCYQFGFTIKDGLIGKEWLAEVTKNSENTLYSRTTDGEKVNVTFQMKFKNEDSKVFHSTICKGTRANQLFLNFISEQNAGEIEEAFKNVYLWFYNKLTIIFPQSKSKGSVIRLLKNKDLGDFYNHCLNILDTGIDKLAFDEFEFDNPKFQIPGLIKEDIKQTIQDGERITVSSPENDVYYVQKRGGKLVVQKMKAVHKIANTDKYIQFDFSSESDGTNRIMDFIPMLYILGQEGNTVVIDELDRSFHSLISEKFFSLFFENTKSIPSQLIATTHNLMLLDLDKLRRDEIWFVEKNSESKSRLYSLEEFKPRFDKQLIKAYLEGRFGAVPILKDDKDAF